MLGFARNRGGRPSRPGPATVILAAAGLLGLPCGAEVPVEQAYDLYLHTHPEILDRSPFWGMAALTSGVLANVRFFGRYTSHPTPGLPPFPRARAYDCPEDAISAVVQRLFPSPDETNLTHNERELDPIGEIAREQRDRRGLGLRKILALLDATSHYRLVLRTLAPASSSTRSSSSSSSTTTPDFRAEPTAEGQAYRDAVYRILDWEETARKVYKGRQVRTYEHLRNEIADLARRAVEEESADVAHQYPPDIVETALLAYAWRTADSAEDLYRALGDSGAEMGLLRQPDPGSRPILVDAAYYQRQLPDFLARAPWIHALGVLPPATKGPLSPGEIVTFLQAAARYESPIPDLLPFGSARCGGSVYPDCGETSLRNFFLIVLRKGDAVDPGLLAAACATLPGGMPEVPGPNAETKAGTPGSPGRERLAGLVRFFADHPGLAEQRSSRVRDAWSDLLVGLNLENDPIPITYADPRGFNLKGTGVTNLLNLIGHLLPDPLLNTPWPTVHADRCLEIGRRLDHLCHLFSRPEFALDWAVGRDKAVTSEFPSVTFTINGLPQFIWSFHDRHFEMVPGRGAVSKWIPTVRFWTTNYYEESVCNLYNAAQTTSWGHGGMPNAVFQKDLRSPDVAKHLLGRLIHLDNPALLPTVALVFHRTLPLDFHTLDYVANFGYSVALARDRRGIPLQPLVDRPSADKDRLLLEAVHAKSARLACFMIDQGADVNRVDPRTGYRLVQVAAGAGNPPGMRWDYDHLLLSKLIAHGVDLEVKDGPGARTPLHHALWEMREGVELLLKAGADPLARDAGGMTPVERYQKVLLHEPGFFGRRQTVELLLEADRAAQARARAPVEGKSGGK